jgi:hypothetical protein
VGGWKSLYGVFFGTVFSCKQRTLFICVSNLKLNVHKTIDSNKYQASGRIMNVPGQCVPDRRFTNLFSFIFLIYFPSFSRPLSRVQMLNDHITRAD